MDSLIGRVGQVLGKRDFDKGDSVMINDVVELRRSALETLRDGKWFNMWTIVAALESIDKPSNVRYGLSVPLDTVRNGKSVPIDRPLARWRGKVDESRCKV
jgi:hypothetical protein